MALAYKPPGVSIEEIVTPQISPLLAAPALVCLVGLSQGFQTRTDQFALTGSTPIPLPRLPVGATVSSVLSVKDVLDPSKGAADGSGYTLTTDYTVSTSNGTITRNGSGAIADGRLVNVTYTYIPADYFVPTRFFDLGSVESKYGSGLDVTGTTINSPLSYAASIAFENGATSVVCTPLLVRGTPGDPNSTASQPNATQAAALSSWQDTLYLLRDIEDVNVLVPVIGQSQTNVGDATMLNVFQAFQDHAYFMRQEDQYIVNIFGEDSSTDNTKATEATLQSHASTLRSRYGGSMAEQTVMINTAKFPRALPIFNKQIFVGGQYFGSGIAGLLASQPTSQTLTRRFVSGFLGVADPRDKNQKDADAAAGLMVIESKNGNVFVRHGITIDTSSSAKRELSVVRAKHRMIESVRDTLDRQIIGQIIADGNATGTVRTTVIGVLEQLRQNREIVDYNSVQAKLVSLEPTTMQVRFSYRPAFPLNYIDIQFSLDLSTQTISTDSSGDPGATPLTGL